MEEYRNALTRTPTEKRNLGRTRRRWEENVRMEHKEIDFNRRNWFQLRIGIIGVLVNAAFNFRVL